MKKLLLLGMALATACAAHAIPTISGATGGFQVPTASVATGVQAAIDQSTSDTFLFPGFSLSQSYPNTRVLVGIVPNLEVGVKYEQLKEDFPLAQVVEAETADLWNINAKYALPINLGPAQLAVGALYGESLIPFNGTAHDWRAYLAASAEVLGDVKATANLGYGESSVAALPGIVDNDASGLTFGLAAEKPISDNAALGAELLLGDKLAGTTHGNIYATFGLTDNLTARAALANIGQDTQIWLGATYTFGE